MRHDGAKNTCQVTTSKGHSRLRALAVITLLAREASVDHFDNGLKGSELHHGIGDLSSPQRVETLVQATDAFSSCDGAQAVECTRILGRDSTLHPNLDGLKGAERDIGQKLGRSRGRQVQRSLVLVSRLGASNVGVGLLEVFIPAVLERTLSRITDEGWTPTDKDAPEAVGSEDMSPGLEIS